jgi:5'-3' exonuclease
MEQPLKKNIRDSGVMDRRGIFRTLLVDGTNLLKVGMSNSNVGEEGDLVGPIETFLWEIKNRLSDIENRGRFYRHVYVFWDAELSGILRYRCYSDYKKKRDKAYSDYDREMNAYMSRIIAYSKKNRKNGNSAEDPHEVFNRMKEIIQQILEEICVRQYWDDEGTEADDLIAYYVHHRLPGEKICIVSRDGDMSMLVNRDVGQWIPVSKTSLYLNNFNEVRGIPIENYLLKKVLLGDTSDCIYGIDGLGETRLFSLFPEIRERPLTVEYIVERAGEMNRQREMEKKKPLKVLTNITERIVRGEKKEDVFDINRKIMDLNSPMLTEEAVRDMDSLMHSPMDMSGRSFENVAKIVDKYHIPSMTGSRFEYFFREFKKLRYIEEKYYKEFFGNNV